VLKLPIIKRYIECGASSLQNAREEILNFNRLISLLTVVPSEKRAKVVSRQRPEKLDAELVRK
jgi:hypothetical protein